MAIGFMNPMVGMAQMNALFMTGMMAGAMMGSAEPQGPGQLDDGCNLSPAANSCINHGHQDGMMLELALMLALMMEGMSGGMGGYGGFPGMGMPGMGMPGFGGFPGYGGMPGFGGGMPGFGGFPGYGGMPGGYPVFIPVPVPMGGAHGSGGGRTYDGATGSTDRQTLDNNALTVARIAQSKGVDPVTAVATMLVESGGNNRAVGDGGTSFGLFQLHQGGELGSLSPDQAMDPGTNASVALGEFSRVQRTRGLTGGALAAAAQRPAQPGQYAANVDAKMGEARRILEEAGFFNGGGGGGVQFA